MSDPKRAPLYVARAMDTLPDFMAGSAFWPKRGVPPPVPG